jgi:hypothetical protein
MKTYTVIRGTSGEIGVTVKHDEKPPYLLKHCVYHSPTGMETGYGGSGPADLALSILADYFGIEPRKIEAINKRALGLDDTVNHAPLKLHQDFKFHFIASRPLQPGQSYELSGAEIAEWLRGRNYA